MVTRDVAAGLVSTNETKIVLMVMDGVGGLPIEPGGPTELEAAETPHLDALASEAICGLHVPVGAGITPGSGPGHLGLFGYDPVECAVGRGVLSALGVGFDLQPGDVATRGNFCTLDSDGKVVDRRAGRVTSDKTEPLIPLLDGLEIDGVTSFVRLVKDYRFLLVLRGEGLSGEIEDTDPQETGVPPLAPVARIPEAQATAEIVAQWIEKACTILSEHHPVNGVLLRGFATRPDWPLFEQRFGLRAAAIATYPMYRGVARLVGMDVVGSPHDFEEEMELLEASWADYDFFFLHIKPIDAAGEDGDFQRKVDVIAETDALIPRIRALNPDVIIVTGDHSSPAALKAHSWHPVPLMIWSQVCRPDTVAAFGERACIAGGLSPRLPSVEIMPIALANALRLEKFGA